MDAYSQVIYPLDSSSPFRAERARIASPAIWLLPNFVSIVFTVTLLQVLFLSAGIPRLFHDSDTGWHVRNGETILSTTAVPRADHFSYTRAGAPWFAWEWLSDVVFGVSHRFAGLPGVALIAALAIAVSVSGAAYLSLSLGGNPFFTAFASVLLLGTSSMHWFARPHVFSWILSLAFLAIVEGERRHPGRSLYWLPALAALWANLHGSFLLGPAILFIYAAGEWIAGRSGLRFTATSLACLLATCVNPYGWRLHEHIFAYLQNDYLMDHISEFRSFSFHAAGALYVELFLAVATLGTVFLFRQRAFGPALLSVAMLHVSLYSARHLPVAAVLLLPLSIAALTREARTWPTFRRFLGYSDRLRAIDSRIYGIVPTVVVLAFTLVGVNALARSGRVGFDAGTFPVRAADFLEQRSRHDEGQARVFAKDQWSGYLIYRFNGGLKVFLDGRSDFYGQEMLERYAQVVEARPAWDTVLKQYDVRFVLTAPDNALATALQLSGTWKPVYSDPVAAVYERIR